MKNILGIAAIILLGASGLCRAESFNLSQVGTIAIPPTRVEVSGNYLLIMGNGSQGEGAYVFNLNSPTSPTLAKFVQVYPYNAAHIFGNHLYMRGDANLLLNYDLIANSPPEVIPAAITPFDFTLRGNIFYMLIYDAGTLLTGIDLTNGNRSLDHIPVTNYGGLPGTSFFDWAGELLVYYSGAGITLVDVSQKSNFRVIRIISRPHASSILYSPDASLFFSAYSANYDQYSASEIIGDGPFSSNLGDKNYAYPRHNVNQLAPLSPNFFAAATQYGVDIYQLIYPSQTLALRGSFSTAPQDISKIATYNGNFIYAGDLNQVRILQYTGLPLPQPEMDAQVVSQPGPQVFGPGQMGTLQITMKNTGIANWTQFDYSLALIDDQGGWSDQLYPRAGIGNSPVAPGQDFTFTFDIKAPTAGLPNSTLRFQMVHEFVEFFGPVVEIPVAIVQNDQGNAAKKWFLFN